MLISKSVSHLPPLHLDQANVFITLVQTNWAGSATLEIQDSRLPSHTNQDTPELDCSFFTKKNSYCRMVFLSGNNPTSWLHLASWNLPDSMLSWEYKMEPSVAKKKNFNIGFKGNILLLFDGIKINIQTRLSCFNVKTKLL